MIRNNNDTVSFISHHKKYLSAQPNGSLEVNRDHNLQWEQFKVKLVEAQMIEDEKNNDNEKVYDPNKKCKISLLGHHNKYICAESNGIAVCDRGHCLEWEQFWSIPTGNGSIGLMAHTGKYVSAEPSGKVIANRAWCKGWEQFKVIQCQDGTVGLKSCHNKYFSAQLSCYFYIILFVLFVICV